MIDYDLAADILEKEIKKQGLSERKLAALSGVSQYTLNLFLRRKIKKTKSDLLYAVFNYLGLKDVPMTESVPIDKTRKRQNKSDVVTIDYKRCSREILDKLQHLSMTQLFVCRRLEISFNTFTKFLREGNKWKTEHIKEVYKFLNLGKVPLTDGTYLGDEAVGYVVVRFGMYLSKIYTERSFSYGWKKQKMNVFSREKEKAMFFKDKKTAERFAEAVNGLVVRI